MVPTGLEKEKEEMDQSFPCPFAAMHFSLSNYLSRDLA
jgi:hypothetical protein